MQYFIFITIKLHEAKHFYALKQNGSKQNKQTNKEGGEEIERYDTD